MSRAPSPVAFRRQQAGFVPAAQRERCATCARVQVRKLDPDITEMTCHEVGFTTAWAVCSRWESVCQARKPVPIRSKPEIQPHGAETGSGAPAAPVQKEAS